MWKGIAEIKSIVNSQTRLKCCKKSCRDAHALRSCHCIMTDQFFFFSSFLPSFLSSFFSFLK
jgi:hypothetical protein